MYAGLGGAGVVQTFVFTSETSFTSVTSPRQRPVLLSPDDSAAITRPEILDQVTPCTLHTHTHTTQAARPYYRVILPEIPVLGGIGCHAVLEFMLGWNPLWGRFTR